MLSRKAWGEWPWPLALSVTSDRGKCVATDFSVFTFFPFVIRCIKILPFCYFLKHQSQNSDSVGILLLVVGKVWSLTYCGQSLETLISYVVSVTVWTSFGKIWCLPYREHSPGLRPPPPICWTPRVSTGFITYLDVPQTHHISIYNTNYLWNITSFLWPSIDSLTPLKSLTTFLSVTPLFLLYLRWKYLTHYDTVGMNATPRRTILFCSPIRDHSLTWRTWLVFYRCCRDRVTRRLFQIQLNTKFDLIFASCFRNRV